MAEIISRLFFICRKFIGALPISIGISFIHSEFHFNFIKQFFRSLLCCSLPFCVIIDHAVSEKKSSAFINLIVMRNSCTMTNIYINGINFQALPIYRRAHT